MTSRTSRRGLGAVLVALVAILILPTAVAAHAELQTATPKDGATVTGSPPAISGTYSEAMTKSGSSLVLLGPDGKQVATGGVDPANNKRMAIDPVPDLVPGTYTVKSTTKSAADGDVDRKEWSFTVVPAPTPTPTPTLAPSASAAPSVTAPPASASRTANASPAPSAAVDGTSSGGGDVVLPIIAALAIVAVGGALLLGRRGRTG
jgi:methionine-rich copper-binding protein CopC